MKITPQSHLDETRSWRKNVVPKLFRLPVKSRPRVPFLKNPTRPLPPAKCRPLPLHPSSSYALGPGCFRLISELSVQTSLKSLLPRVKVTLLLPGEANSFLRSVGRKLSRRPQLAICKPDPAPRPVLLGSQRVGADDILFYNFQLTLSQKNFSFSAFLETLKVLATSAYIPMRLSWLELSGGLSLEKRC